MRRHDATGLPESPISSDGVSAIIKESVFAFDVAEFAYTKSWSDLMSELFYYSALNP